MAERKIVCYRFGPFALYADERNLLKGGSVVPLTPKEFDTLHFLVRNSGRLISKEEFFSEVWPDSFTGDGSLARNISVLRRVVGKAYIQTIPKSGYRFLSPVDVVWSPVNGGPALAALHPPALLTSEPHDSSTAAKLMESQQPAVSLAELPPAVRWRHRPLSRVVALGLLSVVAVVSATTAAYRWRSRSQIQTENVANSSVLILPVENLTGNSEYEYLCDGLTDDLIHRFGQLAPRTVRVIAHTSSMRLKGSRRPPTDIGREMQVSYVLQSSLYDSDQKLKLLVRLIRVVDEADLWGGEFERDAQGFQGVPKEIMFSTSAHLGLSTRAGESRAEERGTRDAEAYQDYLKGRFFWNKRLKEDVFAAINYFSKALDHDPKYAEAYAGLADSYIVLAGSHMDAQVAFEKARDAAEKAIFSTTP